MADNNFVAAIVEKREKTTKKGTIKSHHTRQDREIRGYLPANKQSLSRNKWSLFRQRLSFCRTRKKFRWTKKNFRWTKNFFLRTEKYFRRTKRALPYGGRGGRAVPRRPPSGIGHLPSHPAENHSQGGCYRPQQFLHAIGSTTLL